MKMNARNKAENSVNWVIMSLEKISMSAIVVHVGMYKL